MPGKLRPQMGRVLIAALILAAAVCKGQETDDPMGLPCGKILRVAIHEAPPYIIVDRTKCTEQRCGIDAFGCKVAGCDRGGITYRFVENELKAELQAQCEKLKLSTAINFTWYIPPSDVSSAASPVAMVCNGVFDDAKWDPSQKMCASATTYKGPTSFTEKNCKGINDDGCKSTGPDFAAGALQIRIDLLAKVQFSSSYMTFALQAAMRPDTVPDFGSDLMSNLGSIFLPFEESLWIAIIIEIFVAFVILLFMEASVNDDIAEGLMAIPDTYYWAFTTMLGGADKAPATIGGRFLFIAHAVFALIIGATYTGAVAAFMISSNSIERVENFDSLATGKFTVAVVGPSFDSGATEPKFLGSWNGGNAKDSTPASAPFLIMQGLMKAGGGTFSMMTYNRLPSRTKADDVWNYDAKTSPCDDNTNVLGVYDAVMCDNANSKNATGAAGPVALVHEYYQVLWELNNRQKIDGKCKLVTVGGQVHPAGNGFAFPYNSQMHIPFSKAIRSLVARDEVGAILRSEFFGLDDNNCIWEDSGGGAAISPQEMGGLFVIVGVGLAIVCAIATIERCFYLPCGGRKGGEDKDTNAKLEEIDAEIKKLDDEKAALKGDNEKAEELDSKIAELKSQKAQLEDDATKAEVATPEEALSSSAHKEETVKQEFECCSGLLEELGDQMGRIEGLSIKLAELRDKAKEMDIPKKRKNEKTNGDDHTASMTSAPFGLNSFGFGNV